MSKVIQHLLSTKDLDLKLIQCLFSRAEKLKRMRAVLSASERILYGETAASLFWEPSTRTRISFEMAAIRLGARTVHLSPAESSMKKGETLDDTLANLFVLGCRFFVIRHSVSGEVARLASQMKPTAHVINAGDGTNEHPSQALLDAFTIRERRKSFEGLEIAILGDILRSRVARSNLFLLGHLGANCRVSGPPELLPKKLEVPSAKIMKHPDEAVEGADVIMALRLQRERGGINFAMPDKEYLQDYGLTQKRVSLAKPDAMIMHPGPINRNVEVEPKVADGPYSVILKQVENGLFMRMAIYEALQGELG